MYVRLPELEAAPTDCLVYRSSNSTSPKPVLRQRYQPGQWTPTGNAFHQAYLSHALSRIGASDSSPNLIPEVQELKDLILSDPQIYMYFQAMFDEVPRRAPYWRDPLGMKLVRDWEEMILVLNQICTSAPEWSVVGCENGFVGATMCALFSYPMGTPSGHAAFLDKNVNKVLKKILNAWGRYLSTPESTYALDDSENGWLGEKAVEFMMKLANAPNKTSLTFEQLFVCDPLAKHCGFKSWDDFFTRKIRLSARPIASPNNDDIIANACESQPYNLVHGARLRDRFFAKGEPYSILDMLAHDSLADQFADCTVYQAYLSALSYHRWHAPVSGTIKRAFVKDGTYFSQPYLGGEDIDADTITRSQGYLSALATRAIILIEADNHAIGLMAFIGIGMDEVSTCDITVREGQHVQKGDEIGMFHFGGSSHCLLFRKGVMLQGFPDMGRAANVPARAMLAEVNPNGESMEKGCGNDAVRTSLNIKLDVM